VNSTLLLGSRWIAAGLLSALSGQLVGRKKETRKMSVIPRLIKTAIFHDSLEFWLSSVGRAYYRGEHSWTPTGETHTSWGMYDALKNGMHLLSCREIIACNAWLSSLGFKSRMNSVRLAKESRGPSAIFDCARCRWYANGVTHACVAKDSQIFTKFALVSNIAIHVYALTMTISNSKRS